MEKTIEKNYKNIAKFVIVGHRRKSELIGKNRLQSENCKKAGYIDHYPEMFWKNLDFHVKTY